jgi:hypothetical protein
MKPGTDNITPPVKGEIRNPNGKPKGTLNRKTKMKMWADIVERVTNPITGEIADLDQVDQAMLTLIGIAKNPSDPRAVKAIQEMLDTLYGKNADVLQADVTSTINIVDAEPTDTE